MTGDRYVSYVGEQADIGYLQVLSQGLLQLLVEVAIVGNPLLVPNLLQEFMELIEIREQRRGYSYDVFIHYCYKVSLVSR